MCGGGEGWCWPGAEVLQPTGIAPATATCCPPPARVGWGLGAGVRSPTKYIHGSLFISYCKMLFNLRTFCGVAINSHTCFIFIMHFI